MLKCKAAVLYAFNQPLALETIDVEAPRKGEILVKMAASGVCHSDLSAVGGVYGDIGPCVLGHEGAGWVEAIGEGVSKVKVGDRIILNWKPACASCKPCQKGRSNLCEGNAWLDSGLMPDGTSRYSVDGNSIRHFAGISTFAEYSVTHEDCAVVVAKDVPIDIMALVGCAVTTGAGAALNAAKIVKGESVAVIGCGGVGLSAIMGAKIREAGQIIAVDRNPAALEMALSLGATHAVLADDKAAETILELSLGGVDYAIEAVGRKQTMELAAAILARGAEAILIGVAAAETKVEMTPFLLVRKEHVIRGSFYGSAAPEQSFHDLVDHFAEGRLPIDKMIRRRPLSEINEALADVRAGALGRNLITF